MKDNFDFIALSISDIIIITLFFTILFTQKRKTQLKTVFLLMILCVGWWVTPLIFKIILKDISINPYTFEWISGIGNYFTPVFFLAFTSIFLRTKVKIRPYHAIFLIVPTISSILLITNESHHLLFEQFSENLAEIVYGKFYTVTIIYMYSIYIICIIRLLTYSIRNSSFFSRQSICFLIGSAIPLSINILGTIKIIPITTYTTPITFALTMLFFALAIFKFSLLTTTPIALQKIVDKISDGYIILNEEYEINDFNKTFLDTFNFQGNKIRGKNFFDIINELNFEQTDDIGKIFKNKIKEIDETSELLSFNLSVNKIQKIFIVEISYIFAAKSNIGILILFKDITQHVEDMETIQKNQEMLIERERLASLGQMVGGIAHSMKTPIFSISGAVEGLIDLVNEYDSSIEDPSVNVQDMHDIAKDMNVWLQKIRTQLSYMSEVITTVKGQAVSLSGDDTISFTVSELFSHTNILMKHEIQKAVVSLNINNQVDDSIIINGNINSLVQVLNNFISNAIQAYGKEKNKSIDLSAKLENNNIIISIRDYGPGIPINVREKLFKEMITTKGKDGTGLGVFMSYSMIKGKFNGDIKFETSSQGTNFLIYLPMNI